MKIEIKDGKFIITGELNPPVRSKAGKSFIVQSSNGFVKAIDTVTSKEYAVSLNIITKTNE